MLLLAEDHPVNRQVLMRQLDMIGFHVDVAEDGGVALERFVANRYGAVLTDLNMPGMNGYELTEAIRDHEHGTGRPRTPIMALTANALQGEAERCLAAGMDDFATKPTSMPVLSAKLRRWLGHLVWEDDDNTDEVLTSDALANLTDGDMQLAASILADFVASAGGDIEALRAAVDAAGDRWRHRPPGPSDTRGQPGGRRRPDGGGGGCDRGIRPGRPRRPGNERFPGRAGDGIPRRRRSGRDRRRPPRPPAFRLLVGLKPFRRGRIDRSITRRTSKDEKGPRRDQSASRA